MKKYLAIAAMAALALTACNKDDINTDGDGYRGSITGVVLNELDGHSKFIELYNTTDKEITIENATLVKYDSTKEGGKSTTWTGAKGMKIAAKGFVVLESSDLADPAEKGDANYKYESENHVFKGGLSPKKNLKIELIGPDGKKVDEFVRGAEGAGWNQVKLSENAECSFSRVPSGNGSWVYAAPTKGAANGNKVADITD